MQIFPKVDNSSERLIEIQANAGYAEFIREFALKLRTEREDVTKAVQSMEKSMMSRVVEKWAEPSNIIGNTAGVSSDLTLEQTRKAHIQDKTTQNVNLMSSDNLELKSFDAARNDEFLDKVKTEITNESSIEDSSDSLLIEAREMVQALALDNPINDGRFNSENDRFILAA